MRIHLLSEDDRVLGAADIVCLYWKLVDDHFVNAETINVPIAGIGDPVRLEIFRDGVLTMRNTLDHPIPTIGPTDTIAFRPGDLRITQNKRGYAG